MTILAELSRCTYTIPFRIPYIASREIGTIGLWMVGLLEIWMIGLWMVGLLEIWMIGLWTI